MLKKFFISMLGTVAGIWLSFFIFLVGALLTFAIILKGLISDNKIEDNSILYVELKGQIDEREGAIPLESILEGMPERNNNFSDIINSIRMAKDDSRIKGIYLDCKGSTLGIASRTEIMETLEDFKKSGKWVYAYGDNFEQGDLYVASVADCVYLNPVGSLRFHGLSATVFFFKTLLDNIGVEIVPVKVGAFKSAVEPFTSTHMSDSSRLQTKEFLDNIWGTFSLKLAENRGINHEELMQWADSLLWTRAPETYKELGLVTDLRYRSEVEDMLRAKLSVAADKDLPLVTPTKYMANMKPKMCSPNKKHVAVYVAAGDIVDEGTTGISAEQVVPDIIKLSKDPNVAALVLRVNSGGGSAFASEQIWKALELFKATGKPFYVSMGDYAASGGYYISCDADKIYADYSTLTGSIGIFGLIPNAHKLVTEKLDVAYETVQTNKDAAWPNFYEQSKPAQIDAMQDYVGRGYETFVSRVAAGRDMTVNEVKRVGGGRVWDGAKAKEIGLVDKLGSLDDAISDIATSVSVESGDFVIYPVKEENIFEDLLLSSNKPKVDLGLDGLPVDEMKTLLKKSRLLKGLSPMQARMEEITIE